MSVMSDPAPTDEPEVVTPSDLIRQVRSARFAREQAERRVLTLASQWATMHEVEGPWRREQDPTSTGFGDGVDEPPPMPVPDCLRSARERVERRLAEERGDYGRDDVDADALKPRVILPREAVDAAEVLAKDERRGWRGLPELAWDCGAPFAAALGLSTRSGRILLRQALTLAHRLPRTHHHWVAAAVETRPAKLVADAVAGQPADVCAWVDVQVARRITRGQTVGPVIAQRLVDEALLALHAEELELARQEKLQARYARLEPGTDNADARPGPDRYGLAQFVIRGDWPDIKVFDDTITALAEAIRRSDQPDSCEPLDVRRAVAVGILADPRRAAALLDHTTTPDQTPGHARTTRKQKMLINFHLGVDAVTGVDASGKPWLTTTIAEWATRDDMNVFVRPVVHCGGCPECDTYCEERHRRLGYEPTDLDRELVALTNAACVFPYCTTPAARCDCDHIVAFDPDGPCRTPTCARCNLAPLCRHHHRLKTLAGWQYRQLEPGSYLWTEPHGQRFHTNRYGTRDATDP